MRMRNLSVAIVVAALVGTFPAIEALAQPPSNDSRAGAVLVTSVPFSYAEDTSEATASGPKFCWNNGSVFFKLHATADQDLQVDTFGSDYDTVLAVFTNTAGVIDQIGCSDDAADFTSAVRFHAAAGTTYVFMVGFCCGNGQSGRRREPHVLDLRDPDDADRVHGERRCPRHGRSGWHRQDPWSGRVLAAGRGVHRRNRPAASGRPVRRSWSVLHPGRV